MSYTDLDKISLNDPLYGREVPVGADKALDVMREDLGQLSPSVVGPQGQEQSWVQQVQGRGRAQQQAAFVDNSTEKAEEQRIADNKRRAQRLLQELDQMASALVDRSWKSNQAAQIEAKIAAIRSGLMTAAEHGHEIDGEILEGFMGLQENCSQQTQDEISNLIWAGASQVYNALKPAVDALRPAAKAQLDTVIHDLSFACRSVVCGRDGLGGFSAQHFAGQRAAGGMEFPGVRVGGSRGA